MNYFKPSEFACKCGSPTCRAKSSTVKAELLDRLNTLRARVGRPLIVTSGLRCPEYNAQVGGVGDSEHTTGEAADIAAPSSRERYELLLVGLGLFNRVGVGKTFIHFGISTTLAPDVVWLY